VSDPRPVLWHIPISHFSEKARWALAYKGVEHDRRAPQPGAHMAVAFVRTRGRGHTLPLLDLDGRTVGDSSAIIAALEQRHPEPPLYPADPAQRARALALEDFFDEEVGPSARLVGWYEITHHPETLAEVTQKVAAGPLKGLPGGATVARTFVRARYGVDRAGAVEEARRKVVRGFERVESELDGRDYLVGDRFTVADLTAAALLYPIVQPAEGPQVVTATPPGLSRFRDSLAGRPGFAWVQEMFRRHRRG
jgi:glutathione S-transferase